MPLVHYLNSQHCLSQSVGPYKVIMVLFAMSKIVSSKHVIDREPWYTGI